MDKISRKGIEKMNLDKIIACIQPANKKLYDACITRFDHIAKPVGSLGKFETLIASISAASHTENITESSSLKFHKIRLLIVYITLD